MQNDYNLEIACNNKNLDNVIKILNINPDKNFKWKYEIIINKNIFKFSVTQKEGEEYFDYINYFLDVLEDKYIVLKEIGITNSDITIWRLYKYDEQCNMEFSPNDSKRLGEKGITLCVSCWTNI